MNTSEVVPALAQSVVLIATSQWPPEYITVYSLQSFLKVASCGLDVIDVKTHGIVRIELDTWELHYVDRQPWLVF